MSVWTHVAGCIRIDGLYEYEDERLSKKFGIDLEQSVPSGSEGPLYYRLIKVGNENSLCWGEVFIWGDLRDYGNADEIYQWIKSACAGEMIRCCAVKIDVEYDISYLVFDGKDNEILMKEV